MSQLANAIYYPSWKVYSGKPPSSLNVNQASHVLYSFVGVNEDGTLRPLDDWADNNVEVDGVKGCFAALSKLKQSHPHLKTMVSLGGASASKEFPALAANPHARDTLARELKEFVERHDLDGVDVDWEHPSNPTEGQHFLHLLYAIRCYLPGPRYQLTTALPPGEWVLGKINLARAAEYLDYLNLMAYDLTGPWTDVAGHQAQLFPPSSSGSSSSSSGGMGGFLRNIADGSSGGHNHPVCRAHCASGVDYAVRMGFPPRKILLGVPAYARYFPGAKRLGDGFAGAGEMDYADFPDQWVAGARTDEGCGAASFVDPEKGFVSFDSVGSVRAKARFVKQRGLGGLMYWTGTGDRPGRESLVGAGFLELHGYPPQ